MDCRQSDRIWICEQQREKHLKKHSKKTTLVIILQIYKTGTPTGKDERME